LVVFILRREIRACEIEEVYKLPHICSEEGRKRRIIGIHGRI
jgi:rRNA maturation protein Nop10